MRSKFIRYFVHYDGVLFFTWLAIMVYGVIMLASASLPYADFYYHDPLFFFTRQCIFIVVGIILGLCMMFISPYWWYRWRHGIFFAMVIALVIVLIPGVGSTVKGSMRWIRCGFINLQVSECSKLMMILYIAGFITKNYESLQRDYYVFFRPICIVSVISALVLLEPDFGTVCVLMSVTLIQLFIAGARLRYVLVLFSSVSVFLYIVAISAPYRVKRLMSFMDPWAHQDAESYQLVHALIAVSSGGWFGNGLGESTEKLFYLPEAHTDFLLAIIAEELGLLGVICLMLLFIVLLSRIWYLAYSAFMQKDIFIGSVLVGIASWWGVQIIINIGVNMGCLPTKGITLPFISYGGSSMVMCCAAMGLLMRCSYELQKNKTRVK